MIRRWAAWLVVIVVLAAMATARLADRRKRVHRSLSNVTVLERSDASPAPAADGGDR